MATTITIQTTDAEDAAILFLTTQASVAGAGVAETPLAYVTRIARHGIDFAVQSKATSDAAAVDAEYAALSPADKASVDTLLAKAPKPAK